VTILPVKLHRTQSTLQSGSTFGQALLACRKAPSYEAFAFLTERDPGRQPQTSLSHELLAEAQAVRESRDAKECVHGARRNRRFYSWYLRQARQKEIA